MQTNNQKNMLVSQTAQKLAVDITNEPGLCQFAQSAELIAGNAFYLFVGKAFTTVARKIARIETRADSLKRRIIYIAKSQQCEPLLEFMEGLAPEDIRDVGMEFLCITAKKIAKNHSLEHFSRFVKLIFNSTGFENGLVKIFLFADRSENEICALLDKIRSWADEEIFARTVISVLDYIGSGGHTDRMCAVINKFGGAVRPQVESSKLGQRVLLHFFQASLASNERTQIIINALSKLEGMGFHSNYSSFNKMLDMVNKSGRRDNLMESLVLHMEQAGVEFNLVTYNCILDYYCSNDQFSSALALYNNFEAKGVEADNYTFSILLKGIKNDSDPDLDFAQKIVEAYLNHNNVTDLIILNSAIDMFLTHNAPERADAVFKLIAERTLYTADQVTYSTLIKGSCKNKNFEKAIGYFNQMKVQGLKPNRIVYNSLMDLAVKDQKLKLALNLIEEMQKDEISADGYTYCIILNGLKINESTPELVRLTLERIKKVLAANQFRLDEALFNTILDVCFKYDLEAELDYFYNMMRVKGVAESPITYGTLIKAFSKQQKYDKVIQVFDKMLENKIMLHDMTYGSLLDACSKIGRMDYSLRIFDYLEALSSNMNSIIFTTMLKGYIKNEQFAEAIKFFERVKKYTNLNGMIITYNCALDLYVRKNDVNSCIKLFDELCTHFTPDVISYSTVIKGLALANRKSEAYAYVKKMVDADPAVDVSVVNLFLDSCSNVSDCKLGVQAYEYVMGKNVSPNEITFGIMIKVFGFARDLQRAFDMLDLMVAFGITPSIVVYTNLIHVSFYNKNPKKADLAFTLFKRAGLKGDRLMYSKLIDGFMRYKEHSRVIKYIDLALKDNCALKPNTMDELYGYFHGDKEMLAKLREFDSIKYVENTSNQDEKNKRMEIKKAQMKAKNKALFDNNRNNNNNNNTEAKADIAEDDSKPKRMLRGNDMKKDGNNNNVRQVNKNDTTKTNGFNADGAKKPLGLFNFRTKS